jgi:hypothetical protein
MGFRPISCYFGDMVTYSETFEQIANNEVVLFKNDFFLIYLLLLLPKLLR